MTSWRLRIAVGALALVISALGASTAALQQTGDSNPSTNSQGAAANTDHTASSVTLMEATQATDSAPFTAEITGQPQTLAPNQDATFHVKLSAPTQDISGLSMQVVMSTQLITTTDQAGAWLDSTASTMRASAYTRLATKNGLSVSQDEDATVSLTIPAQSIPTWQYNERRGLLGFALLINGGSSGSQWIPIAIPWNIGDSSPAPLDIVVPITAEPTAAATYTADELARFTADGGDLDQQLSAVQGLNLTLAIDPKIITSIQGLGDKAPPSANQWLQAVQNFEHVIPLAYGDADMTTLARAGATALPSADIGDFPWSDTGIALPEQGRASEEALRMLRASEGIRAAVVETDELQNQNADITATSVDGLPIVGSNHNLNRAIAEASEPDATTNSFRRAVADAVALGVADNQFSSVTAMLSRNWHDQAGRVGQLLRRISGQPGIRLAGGLTTSEETPTETKVATSASATSDPLAGDVDTADSIAIVSSLMDSLDATTPFARAADDPNGAYARASRPTLSLLSSAWSRDEAWRQAVTDQITANGSLANAVTITSTTDLTLVSGTSQIPVSVNNDSASTVTVLVGILPSNGRVITESSATLQIDPHSSATAKVPVRAVANGHVDLRIQATNEQGEPLGSPVTRAMQVQAEWETWGAFIGGGLIASLFGFGLARAIHRKRVERAATAASEEHHG